MAVLDKFAEVMGLIYDNSTMIIDGEEDVEIPKRMNEIAKVLKLKVKRIKAAKYLST